MTSYAIQLILMNKRYNGERHSVEEIRKFKARMQMFYWLVFVVYLGVWFFIWRMSVTQEAIVSMDWILTVLYFMYLIFQVQLVR